MGGFRRGGTAIQVALSFMVIGGFCSMALELAYLQAVVTELQVVADASSHAAVMKLNGTQAGVDAARAEAIAVAGLHRVNGKNNYVLNQTKITFGEWDSVSKTFVQTADPARINTVSVVPSENGVGLGLGKVFLGTTFNPSACGSVTQGPGNANTGVVGGPGVENGHFDVDTVLPRWDCPGPGACGSYSYYMHSHTYDDSFNTTFFDTFNPSGGHFPINGCVTSTGSKTTCNASLTNRLIPKNQGFKLLLSNTKISKGGNLVINGVTWKVLDYGNIPVNSLPGYTLDSPVAGLTKLTSLVMNFNIDSIASCELHPTPPSPTWDNVPGIYNEWRNGSLTLQAVKFPGFIQNGSPSKANGGHQPVINFPNGLLWENYFFWHWEAGIPYTTAYATQWLAKHDQLQCFDPEFIDEIGAVNGAACN